MTTRRAVLAALTALLLVAAAPPPVSAGPPLQLAQAGLISLQEAAERVRASTGGKVLAAETVHENGRTYYLVRVLVKKGQVRVFRVDPQSGRIF